MSRVWYTSDRVLTAAKRVALFAVVLGVYFLLIQIEPLARADAWGRHQLVRIGTSVGNAIARLVASDDSLATQLADCTEDRQELTVDVTEQNAALRELEELRGLLAFQEKISLPGIAARVLTRSVGGVTSVTIDRGSLDGLTVGMAAVISNGIYFGMVTDVDEHRATVRLSTDRSSQVPAAILGKHRTIGLAEGQEGALLAMNFVPQDADIHAGDIVVTSGLDGLMPEGLVIGTLSDVIVEDSAPFKRAIVEPLHDPREWSTMLIIPPLSTVGL